jgi:hypothetical protein
VAAIVLVPLIAAPVAAQLRPYEPFDWSVFDRPVTASVALGGNALWRQRASLAGTEGTLLEVGTVSVTYRADRVAIEMRGTIFRDFRERSAFAEPVGGAAERPLGRRSDVGDYRVGTGVLLTRPDRPVVALLRFGSRLPTTDNTVGLERDAIDFYSTIGARADFGPFRATGEVGLGIHGTRDDRYEQADVLLYILGLSTRAGRLVPSIFLMGQALGTDWAIRGTEPLAELRFRVQTPGTPWARAELIKGLSDFSPGHGVSITFGGTI